MQTWQRLLWKEYRESSPFVLIGVSLPLIGLAIPKFRYELVVLPLLINIITLMVWAASRALEKRDIRLPISAPVRLACRYLLPVPGVLLIGAALGWLTACRLESATQPDLLPLVIGICLLVFSISTVISSIYGLIPTIAVLFFLAFLTLSDDAAYPAKLWPSVIVLLCGLVAAVFWEGYRGKNRMVLGRIVLPLCLLIVQGYTNFDVVSKEIPRISSDLPRFSIDHPQDYIPPTIAISDYFLDSDGTLTMGYYKNKNKMQICLFDMRIPRRFYIDPDRIAPTGDYIRSLNCLNRRVALFAVQSLNDEQVRVMAWDTRTGKVSEFFRFTGMRKMMTEYFSTDLSPDNRWLALCAKSKIGAGYDIWLLDFQRKTATMVVPNAEASQRNDVDYSAALRGVIWTADRVMFQLEKRYLAVDLRTLRVSPLRIGGLQ